MYCTVQPWNPAWKLISHHPTIHPSPPKETPETALPPQVRHTTLLSTSPNPRWKRKRGVVCTTAFRYHFHLQSFKPVLLPLPPPTSASGNVWQPATSRPIPSTCNSSRDSNSASYPSSSRNYCVYCMYCPSPFNASPAPSPFGESGIPINYLQSRVSSALVPVSCALSARLRSPLKKTMDSRCVAFPCS